MNEKVLLHVLVGAWNNNNECLGDGCIILGVSDTEGELQKTLRMIATNKAKDYLKLYGKFEEEIGNNLYEITDENGSWAKFYIAQQNVELSPTSVNFITREQEKQNKISDIVEYLDGLYESGNVEEDVYDYMKDNAEVITKIRRMFEKRESCNVAYNDTMSDVVEEMIKIVKTKQTKLP